MYSKSTLLLTLRPLRYTLVVLPTLTERLMNQDIVDKHRFTLMAPTEVMMLPDPRWVIDKVLPAEVVAQFFGESGSYKSFVSLDMALQVCTGQAWLGKYACPKAKVVYVAGEGVIGYKKRIKSWLDANNLDISAIEDNFRFLPESLPLNDHLDCQVFLHKVREFVGKDKVDLIVLDTQARCTEGVDENSNTEMGLIVKQLDAFKKTLKTTVMLVHHSGRNGPWDRGASAVKGALDTQFKLEKSKNKMVVRFTCSKQKDWEDGWFEDILMTPVGESLVVACGEQKSLSAVEMSWTNLSPKRKEVLGILQKHYFNGSPKGISYSDWLDESEKVMTKAGFIKALTTFKDMHLIQHSDDMYLPSPGVPMR